VGVGQREYDNGTFMTGGIGSENARSCLPLRHISRGNISDQSGGGSVSALPQALLAETNSDE
jgi:hypothetical protein